jgi:hypothetical protein
VPVVAEGIPPNLRSQASPATPITMMGLGSVDDVPLAEARHAAGAARKMVRQGINPIDQRRAVRGENAALAGLTFAQVAVHISLRTSRVGAGTQPRCGTCWRGGSSWQRATAAPLLTATVRRRLTRAAAQAWGARGIAGRQNVDRSAAATPIKVTRGMSTEDRGDWYQVQLAHRQMTSARPPASRWMPPSRRYRGVIKVAIAMLAIASSGLVIFPIVVASRCELASSGCNQPAVTLEPPAFQNSESTAPAWNDVRGIDGPLPHNS